MTTESKAPTIQKLGELEQQTRTLIKDCNAAGFHGATVIDMFKAVMEIMEIEAAEVQQASPVFRTREAAEAYAARKADGAGTAAI